MAANSFGDAMPANKLRVVVKDPLHVQDENGDIIGYLKDPFNTIVYTRPYGITVTGSRALVSTDLEQVLDVTAAATLTIPNDDILGITDAQDRRSVAAYQVNAGAVAFAVGAGVTLRGTAPTAAQYTIVGIMRVGANEWAYL